MLRDAGVPVYETICEANEMIITAPRAYHFAFNYGFNLAEAINLTNRTYVTEVMDGACWVKLTRPGNLIKLVRIERQIKSVGLARTNRLTRRVRPDK